jgi:hypothetical protein
MKDIEAMRARREGLLENDARKIAKKFGCTEWQALAIAVQIERNHILLEELEEIRKAIDANYGG